MNRRLENSLDTTLAPADKAQTDSQSMSKRMARLMERASRASIMIHLARESISSLMKTFNRK